MPRNAVPVGAAVGVWDWSDAVVAAVLAVCLATAFLLLASRAAGPVPRAVAGPAALVVALALAVLTHGETVGRSSVVVAAVVLVAPVVLMRRHRRPRRAPGAGPGDEIAHPRRRC